MTFKSILNIRKLNVNKFEEFLKFFEKLCHSLSKLYIISENFFFRKK